VKRGILHKASGVEYDAWVDEEGIWLMSNMTTTRSIRIPATEVKAGDNYYLTYDTGIRVSDVTEHKGWVVMSPHGGIACGPGPSSFIDFREASGIRVESEEWHFEPVVKVIEAGEQLG